MPTYVPFVLAGLLVVGLVVWSIRAQLQRSRSRKKALDRLGFSPCLDRKSWGMFVRFRDSWCSVASASWQIPFRVDDLVTRIRPLL